MSVSLCFPIPQGQVCCFSVFRLCDHVALSHGGWRDVGWSLGSGVAGPFRSFLPWLTRFSEFPLSFRDSERYTEGVSIQRLPLIWQWLQGVKTCWEPAREGGLGDRWPLVIHLEHSGLMAGHVGMRLTIGEVTQVDLSDCAWLTTPSWPSPRWPPPVVRPSVATFGCPPHHTMGPSSELESITRVYEVKCRAAAHLGLGVRMGVVGCRRACPGGGWGCFWASWDKRWPRRPVLRETTMGGGRPASSPSELKHQAQEAFVLWLLEGLSPGVPEMFGESWLAGPLGGLVEGGACVQ